jgi:rhamnosyltransferase
MTMPDESPSPYLGNSAEQLPVISVAILVRNGGEELANLLAMLVRQKQCAPFEIVAVDSQSTDGSIEILERHGVRIQQIDVKDFRFGTTRQLAFSLTRGRVIVTMSQDTLPMDDNWLRTMTEPILGGHADIVQATEAVPQSVELKSAVLNFSSLYAKWSPPWDAISCVGMAISRQCWQETGFGDVLMSEDHYLGMLARQKGFRLVKNSSSLLRHGHDYSVISLIKRSFNEGLGAITSDGHYSLGTMLGDIFTISRYRMALSAALKHRRMRLIEVTWLPIRPIFSYLGYRFGKKYWR